MQTKNVQTPEITQEKLLFAYKIAAKIVALFGDEYLPIFERLHNELEISESKNRYKLLALTESVNYTNS